MKKAIPMVALGVAAALTLGACGSAPAGDASSSETSAAAEQTTEAAPVEEATTDAAAPAPGDATDFLACMVSDAGGFDDKSFNQSGHEGLVRAESELGVAIKAAESKDAVDYAPNLSSLVAQGCNITVTVGFLLADATTDAATANPDAKFAIIDDNSITLPNVKSLVFNTAEASFLAGYVAAATSTTGKVATFGGMQIPSVTIFMDGFVDGVARYNADKGASVQVLGWDKAAQDGSFTGDFDNQANGQNLTKTFIDQGADIIMPVAGPVGHGAIAAAKEAEGVSLIWVDADAYETVPEDGGLFLTSVVKEIGASVFDTIQQVKDGGFTADPYIGTLANGGVSIAPFHDFDSKVSAETKAELAALTAQIISGELVIDSPSKP